MRNFITICCIFLLTSLNAFAANQEPVGKIVKVEGRIDITSPGEPARPAKIGSEIFEKDAVRSKSNSRAEIIFKDGSVLRLAQKTRVEISEYYVAGPGRKTAILKLWRGRIETKVKKLFGGIFGKRDNKFEVHTPTSVCGVRGTDYFSSYINGASSFVFKKGYGYGYNFKRPNVVKLVSAGQAMIFAGANAPPVVRPASPVELNRLEKETAPVENKEKNKADNGEKKNNATKINNNDKGKNKGDKDKNENVEKKAENGTKKKASANSSTVKADNGGNSGSDKGSTVKNSDEGTNKSNTGTSEVKSGTKDQSGNAVADNSGSDQVSSDSGTSTTSATVSENSNSTDTGSEAGTSTGTDTSVTTQTSDTSTTSTSTATTATTATTSPDTTATLDSGTTTGTDTSDTSGSFDPTTSTSTATTTTTVTTSPDTTSTLVSGTTTGTNTSVTTQTSDTSTSSTGSTGSSTPYIPPPVTAQPVSDSINIGGTLFEDVSGTHSEGDYVLPNSVDPWASGNGNSPPDVAEYQYEYFVDGNNNYIYGRKEAIDNTNYSDTLTQYLPDGTMITTSSGKAGSAPITMDVWSGSLSFLSTPPSGYYLRYSNSYPTTVLDAMGTFNGTIDFEIANLWGATSTAPLDVSLSGGFSLTSGSASPVSLFKTGIKGTASDGSVFYGALSGVGESTSGLIDELFIDPTGSKTGVISGEFSGSADESNGTWTASGTMYPTVLASDISGLTNSNFLSSIENGKLDIEGLAGSFSGSSQIDIKNLGYGDTNSIKGQEWGIFSLMLGADSYYDSAQESSTWSASLKGHGTFGMYQDNSLAWDKDVGLWTMDISGKSWSDPYITGDVSGEFMTMTKEGTISGSTLGFVSSTSNWQATSMGMWNTTKDLKFSSNIDASIYTLHAQDSGNYFSSSTMSQYNYQYDPDSHEGGYNYYNASDNTDTSVQTNLDDLNGTSMGFYSEKWIYDHNTNALISYSAVSVNNPSLSTYDIPPTGVTWDNNDSWVEYDMFNNGNVEGIMGGLSDIWTATSGSPAGLTFLSLYNEPSYVKPDQPVIFANRIESLNPYNGTATTPDNGAYAGFIGGVIAAPDTMGDIYTIYIDPQNNAGILIGNFSGNADSGLMSWNATGGLYPVQLSSNIGVTPDKLLGSLSESDYNFWGFDNAGNYVYPGSGYFLDPANQTSSGSIDIGGGSFSSWSIKGAPWGVWEAVMGGLYTGTPGSNWLLSISPGGTAMTGNYNGVNIIAEYGVSGTWSANKIDGNALGAWVSLNDVLPLVGISSGKIKGTFDPSNASAMTWQTYGTGVWVEASHFLQMASTASGRATLESLNIPAFEIGKATLSGSSGVMSVTMNNVTFFAPSTGGTPQIWATGNISGNYSQAPPINQPVPISGNGLSAQFNLDKWGNNAWAADVSGSGTLNRSDVTGTSVNVGFTGVAGGTYSGTTSGTFTGAGAGVVSK